MLIFTSSVDVWGLEVETLERKLTVNSSIGTRVRVDRICRDCELEISGILLTVDLRVMDILEFDVILRIGSLTAYRVILDCDCRWVTTYTRDGIVIRFRGTSMMLYPRSCTTLGGVYSCWVG